MSKVHKGAEAPTKHRKAPEDVKETWVRVRVMDEQRALLFAAAEKAGATLSTWIRLIALERARQDLSRDD